MKLSIRSTITGLIATIFVSAGISYAQIQIVNLILSSPNIEQYEKLEIQFSLQNASYDNSFDPNQIDIKGIFTSPDSDTSEIWGFWNGTHWFVRFAPTTLGLWQYQIVARDMVASDTSGTGQFEVTTSSNPGFIKISEANSHYLEYSNGDWYYGIGLAKPWFIFEHTPTIFQDMEEHGMNSLIVWMPSWESLLVRDYFDKYDLGRAVIIEQVIEAAEQHGVKLIFTIWNHDALRGEGHPWEPGVGRPYYDAFNAFRHIAHPADYFFVSDSSWYYQQNLYRYIIARWGYSTSIGIWAIISELDGTGSSSYSRSNPNDHRNLWFERASDYFRANDPYLRPTSGSLAAAVIWDLGFNITDIPQVHFYNYWKPNPVSDGTWTMAGMHRQIWDGWEKPAFFGEFGPKEENNLEPEYQHNAIWACLMNGSALSPMDWNDDSEWGAFEPEMFDQMLYLNRFVNKLDLRDPNMDFMEINISNHNLKAWGMLNSHSGILWLWDKEMSESLIASGSLEITSATTSTDSGSYIGYWYDTWIGEVIDSTIFEIGTNGDPINLNFPDFYSDIAFRYNINHIEPEDTSESAQSLFCPLPHPNPFDETLRLSIISSKGKNIRITIYDMLGKKVIELIDTVATDLNTVCEWNGKNQIGVSVSNGIYLCSAEVGDRTETRKVLKLK